MIRLGAARASDVPAPSAAWLDERDRRVLAGFTVLKRRHDWLLGRWTAKRLLAGALGVDIGRVGVQAAADGAPDPWCDGSPVPVWSLSISHRAGRALAAIEDDGHVVGCDLELIEPRSDAFVADWLAPAEQRVVTAAGHDPERHRLVNTIWTAKEAAAKVVRSGLRVDVREVVVTFDGPLPARGAWTRFTVSGAGDDPIAGWCTGDDTFVWSVASSGPIPCPPE